MKPPDKNAPGFGGSRGGDYCQRHHSTPSADDRRRRHKTFWGWNARRDRIANDELCPAPLTMFGKLTPSDQIRQTVCRRLRRLLPSDLIEEAHRRMERGDTIGAYQLARFIEADFARTCGEAE